MRLATFNVENMFERPKAMNQEDWAAGRQALDDYAALCKLIERPTYTASVKQQLLTILDRNAGLLTQGVSEFIRLREYRGKLVRSELASLTSPSIAAEWVGWFDLVFGRVNAKAVLNAGRWCNSSMRP